MWNFNRDSKQDDKRENKGRGFEEVLEKEMEKRNEGEVLSMRERDNRR